MNYSGVISFFQLILTNRYLQKRGLAQSYHCLTRDLTLKLKKK